MSDQISQSLRVAMLARVVFPLHGFGGIERHVFHLVTHLARLGVRVTLYVQPALDQDQGRMANDESAQFHADARSSFVLRPSSLPGVEKVVYLRYDYTSPYLRPNSIL